MKKILYLLIVFSLISFNKNYIIVYADNSIYVDAKAAIAIDSESKRILYEKNADTILAMASTTKIITTLVALKYGNLDEKVVISKKAARIHGSEVGYKEGEKVSLRELLYGLMLRSGNDAAIAISEGVAGSVDEFVQLMNEYALEIGVMDTHFESPHGLDSEYHYTTAYDLAIATAKAKESEQFNKIVSAKDVEGEVNNFTRSYHNINKILWRIDGANGIKTGYTGNAGKCLVTSVNKNGKDVIIVVLNCYNRWKETSKIYNYVEKNYEEKQLGNKGDIVAKVKTDGSKEDIFLILNHDIKLPVKKDSEISMKCDIKTNIGQIKDTIVKGTKLGKIIIYEDDTIIYQDNLVLKDTIEKKSLLDKLYHYTRLRNK